MNIFIFVILSPTLFLPPNKKADLPLISLILFFTRQTKTSSCYGNIQIFQFVHSSKKDHHHQIILSAHCLSLGICHKI